MKRPLFSVHTKSIEWLMAFFMLGWAITLASPGRTLSISAYQGFIKLGLTDEGLLIFYGTVSIVRIITLYMNGSMKKGPEIRFCCSVIGAFTWLLTACLFMLPYITEQAHALPVAAAHHLVMFFGEIYAVGVAAVDRRTKLI